MTILLTLDPMLGAIVTSMKDLVRFKIINQIATGDKNYDVLMQTFALSIMTAIFGMFSMELLKKGLAYLRCKKCPTDVLTAENHDQLVEETKLRAKKLVYWTWLTQKDEEFTEKFIAYFTKKAPWLLGTKSAAFMDMKSVKKITDLAVTAPSFADKTLSLKSIINIMAANASPYVVLYVKGKSIAGVMYELVDSAHTLYLYSDAEETLRSMVNEINAVELVDADNKKKVKSIDKNTLKINVFSKGATNQYVLYADRTLDCFVSRHKPRIEALLKNFIRVNEGFSDFGGYDNHNLGIMVHGKPGTGKTLLFKVICNYLGRNAYNVNMREIKTRKAFEAIFLNANQVKNCVFILDEFDLVQGIIKDRSRLSDLETDEKNGNDGKHSKDGKNEKDTSKSAEPRKSNTEILHERQIELLKLLSAPVETAKDALAPPQNANIIKDELNKIQAALDDIDNALTLETMLTTLDGMIEMRGRVIIAATNYIDRIDDALLRPGRFDAKIKLDACNSDETKEILARMFATKASKKELEKLKNTTVVEDQYTPTELINMGIALGSLTKVLDEIRVR